MKKEKKAKVIEKFKQSDADTGSVHVQVASLTSRISELTSHLKSHNKDFSSQRGLLKMVGQRRRLLNYLRTHQPTQYVKLISDLELRK
ncbi:MAG: 30S ribosomal protein S15 [Bacteriovoracia bacterium]